LFYICRFVNIKEKYIILRKILFGGYLLGKIKIVIIDMLKIDFLGYL